MAEQRATITGPVEYRLGDGPTQCVPKGPIRVTQTNIDATLSWTVEDAHLSASIPLADFKRYVAESAIRIEQGQ